MKKDKIQLEYGWIRKLFDDNSWELYIRIPEKPMYRHIYKTKERAMESYTKYMSYYNKRIL